MSQPAACACGQVLFDVGEKKPQDILTCPWCNRQYRYLGHGKVEPWDGKSPAADASQKSSDAKAKDAPDAKAAEAAAGSAEKSGHTNADDKKSGEKKAEPHPKKYDPDKKPLPATARHAPTSDSARPSVRNKRVRKGEIPGGVGVMVGFIVVFNASAFVLLAVVLPKAADGSRTTPWHSVIPKSAIWPEIAALLVGHLVGFLAWSTYLYYRQQRLNREAAEAAAVAALAAQSVQPAQPAAAGSAAKAAK